MDSMTEINTAPTNSYSLVAHVLVWLGVIALIAMTALYSYSIIQGGLRAKEISQGIRSMLASQASTPCELVFDGIVNRGGCYEKGGVSVLTAGGAVTFFSRGSGGVVKVLGRGRFADGRLSMQEVDDQEAADAIHRAFAATDATK
jgi:hypothetical protein